MEKMKKQRPATLGGVRGAFATCILCASLCLLLPAVSVGKQARVFTGTFGGTTSTVPNPYPLSAPEYVAVDDATGDVYATDRFAGRVEKFDSSGHLILIFGKGVDKTKVEAAGSTEAEKDVCTVASGDVCQAGEEGGAPGALERPGYIAVDNSSGESADDVYVASERPGISGELSIVSKFNSAGDLIASWGVDGQLDGSSVTSPPAPVGGPFLGEIGIHGIGIHGIAVDSVGNLWVQGNDTMFEFRSDANFVTDWGGTGVSYADPSAGIAIDSNDNLYLENNGVLSEFGAAGTLIGLIAYPTPSYGLVVDPSSNELYADMHAFRSGQNEDFIRRYDSTCRPSPGEEPIFCTPAETFGVSQLQGSMGLAIDPSSAADTLYVAEDELGEIAVFAIKTVPDVSVRTPSNTTSVSATLTGTVNPDGVGLNEGLEGCRFEWGETATSYEHVASCDETAAQIGSGSIPVQVTSSVTGLQPGKVYHYRLVAGNANNVNSLLDEPSVSSDIAFGPPTIESVSVLEAAATSATLQVRLDPQDIDTVFHIEYGIEPGVYNQSTTEIDAGSGDVSQSFIVHIQGLVASTIYHYRVVATNSLGAGTSTDQTFTTQTPGGFSLLDGRVWELVSPPNKHGSLIVDPESDAPIQASAEGDAVTYLATAPTESEPEGNSNYTQVLSTRGSGSWSSRDISPPRDQANGLNLTSELSEYRFFSTDLSLGVAQPFGAFDPSLSAEASEQTAFLHTNFSGGDPADPCLSSCYRPLVTAAPGFANVPEGTEFGQGQCRGGTTCGPVFQGASPDGSHILLSAKVSLLEGTPIGSLYEWADGQLQPVSVLPEGTPVPGYLGSAWHEISSTQSLEVRGNAISADGTRIVWEQQGTPRLYLRDMAREETVELGGAEARFQTASTDGSSVFFTVGGELSVFEAPVGGALSAGHVTNLTSVGGLRGIVLGNSRDGSSIYFVANTVLAARQSANGESAQAGQPNLYFYHAGVTKLVAVLSAADAPDWGIGRGFLTTMRVSPNGRWLAFMSDRSLTGYDNRDVANDEPDEEVFIYDADANGGEGRLACASCDPTGARPHGLLVANHTLVDEQKEWVGEWLAANIPAWASPLYQSRYLSDTGRLFFNSTDALVPSDTNGVADVYEYEPPSVGGCSNVSATFALSTGGCVDLLSSGTSSRESAFLDASESGDDVFFVTSAQLSPQDTDSARDVYDARVAGGYPEPQAPPACEGDACQSPAVPPDDPTPGSLTYHGFGNPAPLLTPVNTVKKKALKCAKGRKLDHGKCVKRKAVKKAKKTGRSAKPKPSNKRRAKS